MSDDSTEFLEDMDLATPSAMEEVMAMVTSLREVQDRMKGIQEELKQTERIERILRMETLPTYCLANQITGLRLLDGKSMTIVEGVSIKIPEDELAKDNVFRFLKEHSGLVKDSVIAQDPDDETLDFLRQRGLCLERKTTVNGNSLKAWAKDVLGLKRGSIQSLQPADFPKEMIPFIYREAVIK